MPTSQQPDAATLTAWRKCDSLALHAALRLTTELATKQHGTVVHSTASLTARYGIPARPIDRAKRLLASLGIISKGPRNRWHVT